MDYESGELLIMFVSNCTFYKIQLANLAPSSRLVSEYLQATKLTSVALAAIDEPSFDKDLAQHVLHGLSADFWFVSYLHWNTKLTA